MKIPSLKPAHLLNPVFEECPVCGHYHHVDFFGDCRDNSERFNLENLPDGWIEQIEDGSTNTGA
jgi:hypothetical protein